MNLFSPPPHPQLPRRLEVDTVTHLVTFAIWTASPQPNPYHAYCRHSLQSSFFLVLFLSQ